MEKPNLYDWNEDEWEASELESIILAGDRELLNRHPQSNWRDRGESSRGRGFRYARRSQQPGVYDYKKLMFVPTHLVGRIIGKGGTKIREIEDESEAKVKIGKSKESETDIILSGTEDTVAKAERMINELLKERPPRESSTDSVMYSQFLIVNSFGEHVMDWDRLIAHHMQFQLERLQTLSPIDKDFYEELTEIAEMPEDEVTNWREAHDNIRVSRPFNETEIVQKLEESKSSEASNSQKTIDQESKNIANQEGELSGTQSQVKDKLKMQDPKSADLSQRIPNPIKEVFHAFHPYHDLLNQILQCVQKPTTFQCQAWPAILNGKDVLGIAQSGAGKTLAYLLPALVHIDMQKTPRDKRKGPAMLILAATRELVQQIERECIKFQFRGIKIVSIFGGGDRKAQIQTVNKGVDIVIATPGRLNDLVMAHHINAINFTFIALDEADRMLEMGFEHQIRKSLLDVRPDRQTVITASNCSETVLSLAKTYMKNPLQINFGSSETVPVPGVTQKLFFIEENQKKTNLYQILKNMYPSDRVIVFCGRKDTATQVFIDLGKNEVSCVFFNGDEDSLVDRDALKAIKDGITNILIAPDIPCREIDLEGVTHIINMDFPRHFEEYGHRVAKTAQPGRSGTTITFITRDNWHVARALVSVLKGAQQQIPDELEQMAIRFEAMQLRRSAGPDCRRGRGRGYRGRGRGRNVCSFHTD